MNLGIPNLTDLPKYTQVGWPIPDMTDLDPTSWTSSQLDGTIQNLIDPFPIQ